MKSEKGWKVMMWLWMVHIECRKSHELKYVWKNMKSLCNRRVFVWNPDTSKEIVQFVHEVHPVFPVTLSSFWHMLCGWNYDTMPIFNLFRVHLQCLLNSGSFSSKLIMKCMKNSKWSQKRVEKWWCGFEWCVLNAEKVLI